VGASAVVTNEAPPYAIVAVVPSRVLKFRFISDQIKKLIEIAWWNGTPKKFART
jgi:acetyltransferase-like isoleucine patch superfamily enzyme